MPSVVTANGALPVLAGFFDDVFEKTVLFGRKDMVQYKKYKTGGIDEMNITIQNEYASAACTTLGAELLSFRMAGGKEYLWQRDPAYWAKTSPVLFPYVGPVADTVAIYGKEYKLPRHGFARDYEFEAVQQGGDFVVLKLAANEETKKVYPYEFVFTVTFRLDGPSLTVTYGVVNQDTSEMPFLIGGHPAFFCPMEEGAKFTDYMLQFEDEGVADLHLNYPMFDNDALLYEGLKHRTVKLVHRETKKGVRFDFPDYLSVAFWTPVKKDAPFLCIEPWNAGTLAQVPNTNLLEKKYVQFLGAGESKDYRFSFEPCE